MSYAKWQVSFQIQAGIMMVAGLIFAFVPSEYIEVDIVQAQLTALEKKRDQMHDKVPEIGGTGNKRNVNLKENEQDD